MVNCKQKQNSGNKKYVVTLIIAMILHCRFGISEAVKENRPAKDTLLGHDTMQVT